MTSYLTFASAYRQLTQPEKVYVDDFVAEVEKAAQKAGEPISLALERPIPPTLIELSNGILERALVQYAIRERITQIASETELTDQRIVRELMAIGFSNFDDYADIDPLTGNPTYNLNKCTPEQLAAVKKYKYKMSTLGSVEIEFELYNKLDALEKLARIRNLYAEENAYMQQQQRMQRTARSTITKGENAGEAYSKVLG